jgi:hypothetical protein
MYPWAVYYIHRLDNSNFFSLYHFESCTATTMTWLTDMAYLCYKWPRICYTCRRHFLVLSSCMTYHGFVTSLRREVPLVEQELLTFPEHQSSSFCICSLGHCVVCSSSLCGFWLPHLVSSNSSYSCRKTIPLISTTQWTTSRLNSLSTQSVHDIWLWTFYCLQNCSQHQYS